MKVLAGILVAHGYADGATSEIIAAGVLAAIGVIWGVLHRSKALGLSDAEKSAENDAIEREAVRDADEIYNRIKGDSSRSVFAPRVDAQTQGDPGGTSVNGNIPLTILLGAAVVGLVTGCASFVTDQRDISYEAVTNGTKTTSVPTREITTRAKARTFWDAKSALARFAAAQSDKSQSARVGELGMETSGTNAVRVLQELRGIVQALPK